MFLGLEIYLYLHLQTSTGMWVNDSFALPGCNFSWREGLVYGNIPCKKLDISSTQGWPLLLSPVKVVSTFEDSVYLLVNGWRRSLASTLSSGGSGHTTASSNDKAFEDWLSDDVNSYQRYILIPQCTFNKCVLFSVLQMNLFACTWSAEEVTVGTKRTVMLALVTP